MSTAVFLEEFKGYPIFAIYKVGKNGRKIGLKPIVSFGATKAKAILEHIEEIQEWVDNEGGGADDNDDDDVPTLKWTPKASSASTTSSTSTSAMPTVGVTGADMAASPVKVKPRITIKTPVKEASSSPKPIIKVDLSKMSPENQQAFAMLFANQ